MLVHFVQVAYDILDDGHDPAADVHLEVHILPDQFSDYVVNGVVHLLELHALVVPIWKYVFQDVHFYEVQQLEQQLADAQIFADILPLAEGVDVLQIDLLLLTVFQELFNFLDLFSEGHHPQIGDLPGCLNGPIPEVLPESDDHLVEAQCKQQFHLQIILDLTNFEAMLLSLILIEL